MFNLTKLNADVFNYSGEREAEHGAERKAKKKLF